MRVKLLLALVLLVLLLIPADAIGAKGGKCNPKRPNCTPTTTTTTTTTAPTTTTTAPTLLYPGEPLGWTLYWGATIQGNNFDSPRLLEHEAACACTMGIHRSFFQWTHRTGYMIDQARGDLAAGRLPWISIKTPEWTEMQNGLHDADIDAMLRALDGLSGPIWLTVHHEPDGGGPGGNVPDFPSGPTAWLGMQRKVRERMTALGTDNIAFAPVLMSYTWEDASGRNPEEWWTPGIFDFLGIDHYVHSETANLLNPVWTEIRAWADTKGVDISVGEWGMRGTDEAAGQKVRQWYEAGINAQGKIDALVAFDYDIGGETGNWTLYGQQLTTFRDLLDDPRSALIP